MGMGKGIEGRLLSCSFGSSPRNCAGLCGREGATESMSMSLSEKDSESLSMSLTSRSRFPSFSGLLVFRFRPFFVVVGEEVLGDVGGIAAAVIVVGTVTGATGAAEADEGA